MTNHHKYMSDLISYTLQHSENNPYGSSIYQDDKLLVMVIANEDSPANHAEILAINECARKFPNVKWEALTLYTTGEPCCMCAAACCWANLKEVVYSTDIPFMIELWGFESTLRARDIIKTYPKKPILTEGICHEESDKMFLKFKDSFAEMWKKRRWNVDTI